jgi:hypothetical protein
MESLAERQRTLEDEIYVRRKRADLFRQGQDTLHFTSELFTHFAPDHEMVLFHQRIGQRVVIARTPPDCADLAKALPKTQPCWIASRRPPLLQLLLIFVTSANATPDARFDISTQLFGKADRPPIAACRKTMQLYRRAAPIQAVRNLQAQLSVHDGLRNLFAKPDGQLIAAIAAAGATAMFHANLPLDAQPRVPGFLFRHANMEELTYAAGRCTTQFVYRSEAIVSTDQRVDEDYGGEEPNVGRHRTPGRFLSRTVN